MTTPRALLYGGPRDSDVVDLDFFAMRVHFPRYRDDGQLVNDVYEFNGATITRDTPAPYRYLGEEIPPEPDPSCWQPTMRERRREYWVRLGRAIRGRD